MTAPAAKPIRYNRGIIRPTAAGTFRCRVNFDYRAYTDTLPNLDAAKGWIDRTRLALTSDTKPLSFDETRDARRAMALLPAGASLIEAARDYATRHRGPSLAVKMPEAVRQFLAEKTQAGRRPKTMYGLKSQLSRLADDFPQRAPAELRPTDLLAWLDRHSYQGETRGNFRRAWIGFWSWATRMGLADSNPAKAITQPARDQLLPGILTVDQVCRLFQTAEAAPAAGAADYRPLIPYLAVGFFAGIRPAEMLRLTWGDIRAVSGEIRVGAAASKVRQQRYVKILPNLETWLTSYGPHPGKLAPLEEMWLGKRLRKLRAAAGLEYWPKDCMRHCFGSYHYAAFENAPATAAMMGHRGLDVFFAHYRNLARKSDGAAYFEIRPGVKCLADLDTCRTLSA